MKLKKTALEEFHDYYREIKSELEGRHVPWNCVESLNNKAMKAIEEEKNK